MTIKQQGGIFGRNPEFNDVTIDGDLSVSGSQTNTGDQVFNGNVGINTTPTAQLELKNTGNLKFYTDSNGAYIEQDVSALDFIHIISRGQIKYQSDPSNVTGFTGHIFECDGVEAMRVASAGDVTIVGNLSKGSGSFKIDHPIKPDTHHLVHSFIEGPQADNIYRGNLTLEGGLATVNLDEAGRMTEGTFVALNGNIQCFTTNESGWAAVRGSVTGNILTIEAQDAACTDEVSWLVIGERHDQHMLETKWTDENGRVIVEPEKIITPEMEVE